MLIVVPRLVNVIFLRTVQVVRTRGDTLPWVRIAKRLGYVSKGPRPQRLGGSQAQATLR